MSARWTIPVFSGYGIELEHAIVDRESLAVRPLAEELLRGFAGREASNVERGGLGWSNELVAHVVEVKNIAPTPDLEALQANFQHEICAANDVLKPISACLLPTGMHPWMRPRDETVLWTKNQANVYRTYDRIFDCRRHGWSNIQSIHINLPFGDDEQFARLHAAVRLILPLLPAIAASSPIIEGRDTGILDYRLEAYRDNARGIPAITGKVIPETVTDRADYEQRILAPMYVQIQDYDPAGVLRHEWLNSRGAIARFDRNAIEIRVVDTQECPQADMAIAAAAISAVKSLYDERCSTLSRQQDVATPALVSILSATMRVAGEAIIDDVRFLGVLGMSSQCSVNEFWRRILEDAAPSGSDHG